MSRRIYGTEENMEKYITFFVPIKKGDNGKKLHVI